MNDPRLLRTRTEEARRGLGARGEAAAGALGRYLELEERHRAVLKDVEDMRAGRNELSRRVGQARAAKDEKTARELMDETARIKGVFAEKEARLEELSRLAKAAALELPNIPHPSVPPGASERDNREVRAGGPSVDWGARPADHQALGEALGGLDFSVGAKLAGARFAVLRGELARLERVLAQWMLDSQVARGYEEMWVPYLVRPEILEGTGQLPKFEQDLYRAQVGEKEPGFLIPTAEVPLTNTVRDEILDAASLPRKLTALTPCFRQEAGSYGKDVRGLIRNHQFDKVELVWICRPEDSMEALEALTRDAEALLSALGLPYRVIELCTADLGFASCKTYDLEIWFPSEGRYREVSSCSNCWDFQARRMNARMRRGPKDGPEFVHTLNGSGLAVGRVLAAILENGARPDGSVLVPEPLRERFGVERLTPPAGAANLGREGAPRSGRS